MIDLCIGCRYQWGWRENGPRIAVTVWAIGSDKVLVELHPRGDDDDYCWVPRYELEPLDD